MLLFLSSCKYGYEAKQPAYYEIFHVKGTPYERGYQHGEHFAEKITSIYNMLLVNSIYPYLNREQDDVSSVLLLYRTEEYADGRFSYKFMLESAHALAETMPDPFMEEMQGIADGSGLTMDEILILNTFFDSLMGFRAITFFIKLIQGPMLLGVECVGGLESDGVDNDGDGVIDESNEGKQDPYEPSFYATMVEVPTDTKIKFIIDDVKDGVDPKSIRIQLGKKLYTADHPSITWQPYARDGKTIEVTFTPPGGLPAASEVPILIQSFDLNVVNRQKPYHPRSMRDERITLTTVGYGKKLWQVGNRGEDDGRTEPPSIGFAVRGSATSDGSLYVAHNFAMLDSDITHKHVTLFVHETEDGRTFAYLGYTGLIWGFCGMNQDGLTYFYNSSDTLNNSFTSGFNEGLIFAKMIASGMPIGMMGRGIMEANSSVPEALEYLSQIKSTFGWNILIADPTGEFAAVEYDSNLMETEDGGFHFYTADADNPENLDPWGQMLGSVNGDDLRMASHYQKNRDEIEYDLITFKLQPQRYWSSFFLRSLRVFYNLGIQIQEHYGEMDLATIKNILRRMFCLPGII